MKFFALTIFFILVLGLSGFLVVNAVGEISLEFTPPCPPGLPGGCPSEAEVSTDIGSYITRIYQFGVGISGVLAVGMIVAGAIYYSVSAGSPDKQNDAKSMITSALWGVALLLGSYLILNTINPQIVALAPPGASFASLPDCPTPLGGQRPGVDCRPTIPRAVIAACSGIPGAVVTNPDGSTSTEVSYPAENYNCLPACTESQRACSSREAVGTNGCVRCAYLIKKCKDVALAPKCPSRIDGFIGTVDEEALGPEQQLDGTYIGGVPDCDSCASAFPGDPDVEFGTKWLRVGGFTSGTILQYGYYPRKKDPDFAQCIIHHYKKNVNDPDEKWTKSDLDGLITC